MLLKAFKWRVSAQDRVLQANNFEGRKPLQITSFTKITYFTEIGKNGLTNPLPPSVSMFAQSCKRLDINLSKIKFAGKVCGCSCDISRK